MHMSVYFSLPDPSLLYSPVLIHLSLLYVVSISVKGDLTN